MIEFCSVSKLYPNDIKALDNVNLRIEAGEFVFVVGPSGAGKSTLIKLLCREEKISQGLILFTGRNVSRLKSREVANLRRKLGVIFQDFKLLPERTVFENVAFAMKVIEASNREIRRRVPEVLEIMGLSERANLFPHQLSGGEQQRTAIARAIVNRPSVILADEPTGNLDPDTSKEIMDIIEAINQDGTTVVMATHDAVIVDQMRKRVISIEKGRITRDEAEGLYVYEN